MALLEGAAWRHQHLDWFEPLELLGQRFFLLALDINELVGCLACTPECPRVAWVRLFASAGGRPLHRVWDRLWSSTEAAVMLCGVSVVAVLPTADWLPSLLDRSRFEHLHDVVLLEWPGRVQPPAAAPAVGSLRPMQPSDLADVTQADARAFAPLWQLSRPSLEAAVAQAAAASVIEVEGRAVGYQISTASALGAHLARLAVDPVYQGRGLGSALVADALRSLVRLGYSRVTVNTQSDNGPSIKLYARLGFRQTGQAYPVYRKALSPVPTAAEAGPLDPWGRVRGS